MRALFLDRDGVINKYRHNTYVMDWADFEFCAGAIEALQIARGLFDYLIVVTNQQGVGKGLMSQQALDIIHEKMQHALLTNGVRLDAVYACTMLHVSIDNCRKPNPKMGTWAKKQFPTINFDQSYMIGDSISDMEFGKQFGMQTLYVFNPFKPEKCSLADHYCRNLKEGIDNIAKEL